MCINILVAYPNLHNIKLICIVYFAENFVLLHTSFFPQIAGPQDSVDDFIAKLTSEQVFVRRINSAGIPFHTDYIGASVEQMRTKLQEIIPKPRMRSPRWITSSLGPDQIDSEWGELEH